MVNHNLFLVYIIFAVCQALGQVWDFRFHFQLMQGMLWLIISHFRARNLASCGSYLSLTIADLQIHMTSKMFYFLLNVKVYVELLVYFSLNKVDWNENIILNSLIWLPPFPVYFPPFSPYRSKNISLVLYSNEILSSPWPWLDMFCNPIHSTRCRTHGTS